MKIIHAYEKHTASSTDEEMEGFYDDISNAIEENRIHFVVLIGDFNARFPRIEDAVCAVGRHGYDERNERGQMLLGI